MQMLSTSSTTQQMATLVPARFSRLFWRPPSRPIPGWLVRHPLVECRHSRRERRPLHRDMVTLATPRGSGRSPTQRGTPPQEVVVLQRHRRPSLPGAASQSCRSVGGLVLVVVASVGLTFTLPLEEVRASRSPPDRRLAQPLRLATMPAGPRRTGRRRSAASRPSTPAPRADPVGAQRVGGMGGAYTSQLQIVVFTFA